MRSGMMKNIKHKTLRYRVALCHEGGYYFGASHSMQDAKILENQSQFIKWITEWIEVEVEV